MADKIVNVALGLAGGATAIGVPVALGEYSKSDIYLTLGDISDVELGDDVRSILEERGLRLAYDDDDFKTLAYWNWEKLPNIVSEVRLKRTGNWHDELSHLLKTSDSSFNSWRRNLYIFFPYLHKAFKDFCENRYAVDGGVSESWEAIQDVVSYCTFPQEARKYTKDFGNYMLMDFDRKFRFPKTVTIGESIFSKENIFANLENLCRRDLLFGDVVEDFGKTWCVRNPNKYPRFSMTAIYTLRNNSSEQVDDFAVIFE